MRIRVIPILGVSTVVIFDAETVKVEGSKRGRRIGERRWIIIMTWRGRMTALRIRNSGCQGTDRRL